MDLSRHRFDGVPDDLPDAGDDEGAVGRAHVLTRRCAGALRLDWKSKTPRRTPVVTLTGRSERTTMTARIRERRGADEVPP
jgi:hypothetical protein